MKIFIASGNPHKVKEIKAIIAPLNINSNYLYSIENMGIHEPDEPYKNFMENACHKAKYYSAFTETPTLSEDSGLCIEALDHFPGVYTKDFVVECGGIDNAFAKLEELLRSKDNYNAYFFCAAALYLSHEKKFITFEGKCPGKISFPPRGDKRFAFDPIFMPNEYSQVMAELSDELKNMIGHRGIAIRGVIEQFLKHSELA